MMERYPSSGILVEAEAFDDFGGWVLDSQYELEMGSPYLLAHGNGKPVADATTTISISDAGAYNVWVRTKDWVPRYHPGRFRLSVNGIHIFDFGANDRDWNWEFGGLVELPKGDIRLALHDLTGFCGRCDAIFFSREDTSPPNGMGEEARAWRRHLRGLPSEPVDAGSFDVVVVGGGVPGIAATLTAARLGDRVALIHNRPVLGGNASVEQGLSPRGIRGPLIDEISQRSPKGDLVAIELLNSEPNVTVFLEHTVYSAVTQGSEIVSIDARRARNGQEIRMTAPIFIDCSGKATFGQLSGAETLFGQESRTEYGEGLAKPSRTTSHHGNTVFFRTREADSPVSFPAVPWATEVARDYANLGGQLITPGYENGPGPVATPPDPKTRRRMKMPLTHYWEYGQDLDPYSQGEQIRDHLLRAIYGTFSNVKTLEPEKHANLELEWVAFVPATGEYKRYRGDYVLSENDIRSHKHFPDAVVKNGGAFCLHIPRHEKYDFRLKDWIWDERDGKDYDIAFRCLYSINIENLMMAGKHISVTHVAGSNTKFMGNGGQHAIATAAAAHLCKKYDTTPRGLCEKHMPELQKLAARIIADGGKKRESRL